MKVIDRSLNMYVLPTSEKFFILVLHSKYNYVVDPKVY